MSQLKGNEFIDPKFFDELKKGAEESLSLVKELKKTLKSDLQNKSTIKIVEPKTVKDIENFNKSVKDTRTVIDNLTKAEAKELQLQKELSKLKSDKVYQKQAKEIERLRQEKNAINKATRDEVKAEREVNQEYKKQSRILNDLRNQYKNLAVAGKANTKQAKDLLAQIKPLDKKLKDVDATVGQNFRSVGNYGKALDGLRSKVKSALSIGAVVGLTRGLFNLNNELRKSNQITKTLFDGTIEDIEKITIKARGLSKAFDLDVNEALKTANVLSNQFGLSGSESLDLIEKGISKGANANGQFLDNLSEYSTQFKLAGLTASESISIITQQVKEGVFSDKGVDAIKEATLSLREMTPATVDALKSIGLSSVKIQKDIQSGAKTYFDVIQEVSRKTKEFGEDSSQAGLILADVFKGAGEDAGNFVFNLSDINLKLETQKDILSEADKAQIELDKSWNKFTSDVGKGSGVIGKAFTSIKNILADVLSAINDIGVSYDELRERSFLSLLTQEGATAVEEFKTFIKNLGSEEKRSRKELAEVLLKEDRDRLIKLSKLNDEKSIRESRILKERIKAITEFSKISIDIEADKNKKVSDNETTTLERLKNKLKETNDLREKILNSPSDSTSEKFKSLTSEAENLKKEIKLLQDILDGKERDGEELITEKSKLIDVNEDVIESEKEVNRVVLDLANSLNKKFKSENEKLIESRKQTYQSLNNISEAFAQRQKDRSNREVENIDRVINASQNRVDKLREFANIGNLTAQNSIALEEKAQAEATLKKEKEIQKQKRIESSLALLKTYTSSLEGGQTPSQAIADVLKNGTLLAGLINALPSFDVGTDNTSKHIAGYNGGVDGKGGFLAINHPNEKIFNAQDSAKIGFDVPNSEVAETFGMVKRGLLVPKSNSEVVLNWQSNEAILNKFDSLEKTVKSLHIPEVTYDFDNIEKVVTKIIKGKNSTNRISKKSTGIW